MKRSVSFRVRYLETDRMGFVHHSVYLAWFEVGRTEFLRSLGFSYRQLEEEQGLRLPVFQADCRYLATATYDDEVTVLTTLVELSPARITFAYQVERGATRLAEGHTEHAFLGRAGRPVALPKLCPELYQVLRQEVALGGGS